MKNNNVYLFKYVLFVIHYSLFVLYNEGSHMEVCLVHAYCLVYYEVKKYVAVYDFVYIICI